jgi:hypothetical protein
MGVGGFLHPTEDFSSVSYIIYVNYVYVKWFFVYSVILGVLHKNERYSKQKKQQF